MPHAPNGNLTKLYIDNSISARTLTTYNSRIRTLQCFLEENDEPCLTLEIFAQFLRTLEANTGRATKSTAEGYRCAILHAQRTNNRWIEDGTWADSWHCKRVVAGFAYKGRAPTPHHPRRGQVTSDMFADMLIVARRDYLEYAPALELGYRLALRPSQLLSLHKGCFDGTGVIVPDKRCRSTNRFNLSTVKTVVDPMARLLLRGLDETRTGPYFTFSEASLRHVFKQIASALSWNTDDLLFDGPHCLRHGGMSHLSALLPRTLTEIEQNKILQVTNGTRRRYTNQLRTLKPPHGQTELKGLSTQRTTNLLT